SKYLEDKFLHGRTSVFDMYLDDAGILWIGSNIGLYKSCKLNNYYEIMPAPGNSDTINENITLIDDKKALSSINITPVKMINNLFDFSVCVNSKEKRQFYKCTADQNQGRPSYGCSLLLKNGTVLSGVHNALLILTPDGKMSKIVYADRILSLYRDKEDGIWIGFRNSGLAYYPKSNINGSPVWSLAGQSVSNIVMDKEGGIWATTLEKGIFYASNNYVIDYSNNKGLDRAILSIKVIGDKVLANDYSNHLSILKDGRTTGFDFSKESKVDGIYDYLLNNNAVYIATSVSLLKSDTSLRKW